MAYHSTLESSLPTGHDAPSLTQRPSQKFPPSEDFDLEGQQQPDFSGETVVLEEKLPGFLRVNDDDLPEHEKRKVLRKRIVYKNYIIAFISEFIGTVMFLFCAFGAASQASDAIALQKLQDPNGPMDTSAVLIASLAFGFSLTVSVWVWHGGLQNPSLMLAMFLTNAASWQRCLILSVAQYAGGIAAAGLAEGLLPGKLNARTTLGSGVTVLQGFFIEFFLTSFLLFTVYMLASEKHKGNFLAPVPIGLCVFVAEMIGIPLTGGALNPARSLGPDVIAGRFESYAWIYFAAPYAASILTAALYRLLKWLQYQTGVNGLDGGEDIAVVRDAYGNCIGTIDNVPAENFHNSKAQPACPQNDEIEDSDSVMAPATQTTNASTADVKSRTGPAHHPHKHEHQDAFGHHKQPDVTPENVQHGRALTSEDLHVIGPSFSQSSTPPLAPHASYSNIQNRPTTVVSETRQMSALNRSTNSTRP